MITKTLDENTISLMPEDSDDLLTIRRILKIDDKIIGETTRVIKQDKEYARPDKGERVHVRLAIKVEKISLDNVLTELELEVQFWNQIMNQFHMEHIILLQ